MQLDSIVNNAISNRGSVNTAMALVVDRSGSMYELVDKVVESVKVFISDQDKIKGQATLTIAQFNHEYNVILKNQDIHKVDKNLFERMYQIDGGTALYDAALRAISDMENYLQSMAETETPKRVVIALVTDGQDGSSRNTIEKTRAVIEDKQNLGWDFLLLGSDQTTLEIGERLGIRKQKSALFLAENVAESVKLISSQIEKARRGKVIEITQKERDVLLLGSSDDTNCAAKILKPDL